MEKTFNPSQIEQAMYNAWESKGYFKPSGDNSNGAYCIMIRRQTSPVACTWAMLSSKPSWTH